MVVLWMYCTTSHTVSSLLPARYAPHHWAGICLPSSYAFSRLPLPSFPPTWIYTGSGFTWFSFLWTTHAYNFHTATPFSGLDGTFQFGSTSISWMDFSSAPPFFFGSRCSASPTTHHATYTGSFFFFYITVLDLSLVPLCLHTHTRCWASFCPSVLSLPGLHTMVTLHYWVLLPLHTCTSLGFCSAFCTCATSGLHKFPASLLGPPHTVHWEQIFRSATPGCHRSRSWVAFASLILHTALGSPYRWVAAEPLSPRLFLLLDSSIPLHAVSHTTPFSATFTAVCVCCCSRFCTDAARAGFHCTHIFCACRIFSILTLILLDRHVVWMQFQGSQFSWIYTFTLLHWDFVLHFTPGTTAWNHTATHCLSLHHSDPSSISAFCDWSSHVLTFLYIHTTCVTPLDAHGLGLSFYYVSLVPPFMDSLSVGSVDAILFAGGTLDVTASRLLLHTSLTRCPGISPAPFTAATLDYCMRSRCHV